MLSFFFTEDILVIITAMESNDKIITRQKNATTRKPVANHRENPRYDSTQWFCISRKGSVSKLKALLTLI